MIKPELPADIVPSVLLDPILSLPIIYTDANGLRYVSTHQLFDFINDKRKMAEFNSKRLERSNRLLQVMR